MTEAEIEVESRLVLRMVEACRMPMSWKKASKASHACSLGVFRDAHGLHNAAYGRAHRRFHEVMAFCTSDPARWRAAADGFQRELERALAEQVH